MLLANDLSVGRANKRSRLDKSIKSYQDKNSNEGKNEKIDVHKINVEDYQVDRTVSIVFKTREMI